VGRVLSANFAVFIKFLFFFGGSFAFKNKIPDMAAFFAL